MSRFFSVRQAVPAMGRKAAVRTVATALAVAAAACSGWTVWSGGVESSELAGSAAKATPHIRLTGVVAHRDSASQLTDRLLDRRQQTGEIQLCQNLTPVPPSGPEPIAGVAPMPVFRASGPGFGPCDGCPECAAAGCYGPYPPCVPWQPGDWGEYVERARLPHVPVYRLRVDDQLRCVYRVTRNEQSKPYQLNVGDEVQVESFTDPNLNRSVIVQPDGSITLRLLGQVKAGRLTIAQLQTNLEKDYTKFYKTPAITVAPMRVNTKLLDLVATVDARAGTGGQGIDVRVTPDGTISLPAIGPVPVQGMTLDDLKREIDARYATEIEGIEVTPILVLRAPRFVYVLGEVHLPGRYVLEGPTTVMQALSLAGSWNVGANIKQIVIFRRSDDWRLMATMVNLHAALGGKNLCPAGEIWLGDSDIVLVPKSEILKVDDFIDLAFTRGLYGVVPFTSSYTISRVGVLH